MNIFLLSFIFLVIHLAEGQNECQPTRCGNYGPVIRFPFRLKDDQPDQCGYTGFELTCTKSSKVEFELQFPVTASTNNIILPLKVKVSVLDIDYKAQTILTSDLIAQSCFPNTLPTGNSSASPFDTEKSGYSYGFTLLNCSKPTDYGYSVTCLSSQNHHVIAFGSFNDINTLPQYSSCFKMYNISYVPESAFTSEDEVYSSPYYLHWYEPSCGHCEAEGKYCGRKVNSTGDESHETECFVHEQPRPRKGTSRKLLIAGIISGVFLLLFIIVGWYCITGLMKRKRNSKV